MAGRRPRRTRGPLALGSALCVLLACLAFAGVARAEGEQSYLTALVAPLGSISKSGQGDTAVYLRWDTTQGDYPADLTRFRLERDGTVIYDVPASGAMSVAEIQALYAPIEQERRRLETLRWLREEGAAEEPPVVVDAGNFAARLRARLLGEKYWAFLASRNDFNVARAGYRAYLDPIDSGVHVYELLAVNAAGEEIRIGLVKVDAGTVHVMPGADDLLQVSEFERCDAPERMKTHGTVALNWNHPGATGNDEYVSSIMIAGYDLYRSDSNVVAVDASIDIRQLAMGLAHDADGNVQIPGLQKVNDQPIPVSGSAQKDTTDVGWNPDFAQFVESIRDLAAVGVGPGDKRAYYLVPRDLTGNYGQTRAVLVTVPDLVAPPAPWSIRTVRDVPNDRFYLEWDAVDVLNFYEAHRNRSYCNLNSARFDKTLRFAPGGKTCDDPGVQDVDLDVAEYLVYRFESEPEYSSFADTDGDGRGDLEERVVLSLNPPLTEPGTACDASSWPATAVNHRIGAPVPVAAAVVRESGRKVYRFEDPVPAANKGNVYWYRIMVRDTDGNLSPLSAPVRALFPERARPLRCDDRDAISERRCRYSATSQGVRTDPKTGDPYAVPYALDPTADAAFVRTTCQEADKDFADIRPLQVDAKGERVVPRTPALCEVLVDRCNVDAPMRIDFLSNTGEVLAGTNTSGAFAFCPSQLPASLVQQAVLRKSCEDASFSPVSPGSTLRGALALNCRPEPDECVNIYREIGGRSYHYKRFCPPVPNPIVLDPADLATLGGGEQTCLGIANVNQNAEVGSKLQFCFRLPAIKKPGPPNPIEIRFQDGSQKATLSWAAPQTPLAGTLVQWFMKGALENSATPTAFSDFFADAGVPAHNAVTQQNVDITPEPAGDEWQEEWCFRARAVGLGSNANLSDWSATRCGIRKPIVEPPPPNIPWPEVPATPKAPDMLARYMTVDKMPAILLSNDELDLYRHCPDDIINLPPVCRDGPRDKQSCLNRGRDGEGATLVHCNNLCALTRENVAANIGFVAYRRSSEDPNLPGRYTDFVQVSPLIDKVFCRQFRNPQIGTSSGVIDDPFVKLINFSIGDPQWDGFRFAFLDDYPHVRGRWYQYQLVFFDARGEPVRYRQTDWIQAP